LDEEFLTSPWEPLRAARQRDGRKLPMTGMLITTTSSDDKLDALLYEVRMMIRASNAFTTLQNRTPNNAPADYTARNAFLESFLLHLRNLIQFFTIPRNAKERNQRSDDIIVDEFKDSAGNVISNITLAISADDLKAIHKHLSHLTKTRTNNKLLWPVTALELEINNAMHQFITRISDSYFRTKGGHTKNDFLGELGTSSTRTVSVAVAGTSTSVSVVCAP
jgi:hypothetical protein